MAKQLHEITPEEFEDGLKPHFPRGGVHPDEELPKQRWARVSELHHELWTYRPGAFFLGYRQGKAVGRVDDRHLVVVAGSRAGKGVSILTPNALCWPGSLLALDPKGELAKLTAEHRARHAMRGGLGQRVHVLNPFPTDASGFPTASFNPLWEIDPVGDDDVAEKAGLIADALIVHGGGDTHWTDGARQLVHGVLLYVLTYPKEERHLVTVRQLLTLTHRDVRGPDVEKPEDGLYLLLAGCGGFNDERLNLIVKGIGQSFIAKPIKERSSILSTATVQTAFLDSPKLAEVLTTSSFALRDLKRDRVTVYLCLPASYMGTHGRWLRIVVNMALAAMEDQRIPKPDPPVLMVLDEMCTALGHMSSIEKAAGLMAGYGVRLVSVLQDLTQLKHHYKETWETFIGNAGIFLAFGNSDATTLKYLSEKLGSSSIPVVSQNAQTPSSSMTGASGISTSIQRVPLLEPHEIEQAFARERGRMLVLFPGMRPIIVQRSISHYDLRFARLLDSKK